MERKTRCYIYLLNTLSDWEIAYLTSELNSGRYLAKDFKAELITVGSSLESVETMGGFRITPDKSIESVDFKEGDLLVLPGANTWMEDSNKKILTMLPDLLKNRVNVAAICGATIALAQAGLLNNRKHTSNDKGYLKMVCPDYTGDSFYLDTPAVVDDNLITASGIAPLEFAIEIFKLIKAMKEDTIEAWYKLYLTKNPKYFYSLMESLK